MGELITIIKHMHYIVIKLTLHWTYRHTYIVNLFELSCRLMLQIKWVNMALLANVVNVNC